MNEDMYARLGDSEVEGVIGQFEVPGMKEDGRKVIDLCTKKKNLMDLIVVQEDDTNKLLDLNVFRGAGRGI